MLQVEAAKEFWRQHCSWDCWYIFDADQKIFHVFMLSAPAKYYKDADTRDQHSHLAHFITPDFRSFELVNPAVLSSTDTTSIWSGCVVAINNQIQLYFTERYETEGYLYNQRVRVAVYKDGQWDMLEAPSGDPLSLDLQPYRDVGVPFLAQKRLTDRTCHAWRDPYVFGHQGELYMLLSTKLETLPAHQAGCVSLFKAHGPQGLRWELINPSVVSGYEEMEVPQLYQREDGKLILFSWTHAEEDYQESLDKGYRIRRRPIMYHYTFDDIQCLIKGVPRAHDAISMAALPGSGVYAGVVIPEMGGQIFGFKMEEGDVAVKQGFYHVLSEPWGEKLMHPDRALKTLASGGGKEMVGDERLELPTLSV